MGWLYSIVSAVEKMGVSVCVADMRVAGAPLVYVNQLFCRTTGYDKGDFLGVNCRILQGPQTEVASVSGRGRSARACSTRTLAVSRTR